MIDQQLLTSTTAGGGAEAAGSKIGNNMQRRTFFGWLLGLFGFATTPAAGSAHADTNGESATRPAWADNAGDTYVPDLATTRFAVIEGVVLPVWNGADPALVRSVPPLFNDNNPLTTLELLPQDLSSPTPPSAFTMRVQHCVRCGTVDELVAQYRSALEVAIRGLYAFDVALPHVSPAQIGWCNLLGEQQPRLAELAQPYRELGRPAVSPLIRDDHPHVQAYLARRSELD